jgi:hypothetical protein
MITEQVGKQVRNLGARYAGISDKEYIEFLLTKIGSIRQVAERSFDCYTATVTISEMCKEVLRK